MVGRPRPNQTRARTEPPRGHTAVTCWCEQHVVHVPERWIINLQTDTCGHPDCHPPTGTPDPTYPWPY